MPAPSTDFVKAWCRIDGDEFDAVLPTMISSAVTSACHETGVDYLVEDMPDCVKVYCAAVVAQWLANPEAGTANAIVQNPFLKSQLDPVRVYL